MATPQEVADLQVVIDLIRAASSGSPQLDNAISDYLGVGRGKDFTRNLDTVKALLPAGVVIEFSGTDFSNNGEQMVTIGKPPEFAGHIHGWHPTSMQLAAVCGALKHVKGVA